MPNGVWLEKVSFPETGCEPRTDESFRYRTDPNHHGAVVSPLDQLPVRLVSQFVLDFSLLALVCLGVVKRLTWLWLKSPVKKNCRIGLTHIRIMSGMLAMFREYTVYPLNLEENAHPFMK